MFTPIPGEMIQILTNNMFQMGWFNHQLVKVFFVSTGFVFNHLKWEHNIQNAVKMRGVIHLLPSQASSQYHDVEQHVLFLIAKGEELAMTDEWIDAADVEKGILFWVTDGYKWEGNHRSWCERFTYPVPRFALFFQTKKTKLSKNNRHIINVHMFTFIDIDIYLSLFNSIFGTCIDKLKLMQLMKPFAIMASEETSPQNGSSTTAERSTKRQCAGFTWTNGTGEELSSREHNQRHRQYP